jgi:hypothetical protein
MSKGSSFEKIGIGVLDTLRNPNPTVLTMVSLICVFSVCAALMYFAGAHFAMPVLVVSPTITK